MNSERPQKAAVGCNPTANHQTDPSPTDAEEEFPAAASISSATPRRSPQPEDSREGPDADRQGAASISMPSQAPRKSNSKKKSARDCADSEILPIMRRNREEGQKTTGTSIHRFLKRKYGPDFDGHERTTQRVVRDLKKKLDQEDKHRAENSDKPLPEIFFPQEYGPGEVAQLDCSSLKSLQITIQGRPYRGMIFTFAPIYSGWIYASIVSGETEIEVLEAIQDALWALNGVPRQLRSDNGKALFTKAHDPNTGYSDLYIHYGTSWSAINPGRPNENGGAESANKTVKGLLRDRLTTDFGTKFESVEQLSALLKEVLEEHNAKVQPKLKEERGHLKRLPKGRTEAYEAIQRKVNKAGCITIDEQWYSVPPDLHGTTVKVRKYTNRLVIYDHDGKSAWEWIWATDTGQVDFRHVIHWLRKKPGAFKNYRFKEQMFPTEKFRETHRQFTEWFEQTQGDKDYLSVLQLATGSHPIRQSQGDEKLIDEVDCALALLLDTGERFNFSDVIRLVGTGTEPGSPVEKSAVTQQTIDFRRLAKR